MKFRAPAEGKAYKRRLCVVSWVFGLSLIVLLGLVRTSTESEFAFATAAIFPVVMIAWFGGPRQGLTAACLAAAMWMIADLHSGRTFSAAWVPVLNGIMQLATYAFIAYLVTRVKALLARETELAEHDALTGLLNRRAFLEAGEAEVVRARRYSHPLAVGFVDLDNFKQLNDTQGHEAGDRALREVASALRDSLRATDIVARLGGDEFALLLPETAPDVAGEVSGKIGKALENALGRHSPVSASIGLACFENPQGAFAPMLKKADALMYETKQAKKGGIRFRVFSAEATAQQSARAGQPPP